MIPAHKDVKVAHNEVKLELYTLLGEGYKAMKEGKESNINSVKERIITRRKQNE